MSASTSGSGTDPNDISALARGGVINVLGSVSQAVSAFVLLGALGRGLGASGAGAFMEAVALFTILAASGTLGVETGFIRFIARFRSAGRHRDLPTMFRVGLSPVVVVGLVSALAVWWSADWLGEVFGKEEQGREVAAYLRIMAAFIPVMSLSTALQGATRGYEDMTPTVVADRLVRLGLQAGLVALAVVLGLRAHVTALVWCIPIALALFLMAGWLRRLYLRDLPDASEDPGPAAASSAGTVARSFWRFTLPRTGASVFAIAIKWLDVLLVGGLISAEAAGIYAVSTRLLQLGAAVSFSIGQVSQPMIARLLAADGHGPAKHLYGTATAWLMLATWPQYLFLLWFATPLLGVFGADFRSGATVVAILAIASLLASASGPVDMVLLMAGKSTWSLYNAGISLATNVGLNVYLLPRMGITGAALAWAITKAVNTFLPLAQVGLLLRLHPFGRSWMAAAVPSAVTFGAVAGLARLVVGESLLAALGVGVVCTGLFVGWVWVRRDRLELDTLVVGLSRRLGGRRRARARVGKVPTSDGDR